MKIKYPVNEQTIVYQESGVKTGLWGRGKLVPTFYVGSVCTDKNCKNVNEHVKFDGQIFFKKVAV